MRVHLESEDEYSANCTIRIIKFVEVDENTSAGGLFGTKLKSTVG